MYDDYQIKPLHIMLSKTRAHVKSCDGQIKWMYFLIEDGNLLNKYNTIWDNVNGDLKKELDSKPVCNKKFLKTKIKSCCDEVTDCYDKEIHKVDNNSNQLGFCSRE